MAIEVVPITAVPERAKPSDPQAKGSMPPLPIDCLLPDQSLRVPFADLGSSHIGKAFGVIRVRAHRLGKSLGRKFKVHKSHDAFYVTRVA